MLMNDFSILLTFDKNLQHQQNFKKYEIVVFVLTAPNKTDKELTQLSGIINAKLKLHLSGPGPIIIGKND